MQNQELITQKFPRIKLAKSVYFFSFNVVLYLATVAGTGALLFELYPMWTFKLGITIISTFGIISLLIFRQIVAMKEQMKLLKEQEMRNSDIRFQAMVENSSDMITIRDNE